MNKYIVFGGDYYYPIGGMNDKKESFDCIKLAIDFTKSFQWWHIVDRDTWLIVKQGSNQFCRPVTNIVT